MFTKEEFLNLLNFLYLKARSEEYAGKLAVVSPEIKKIIVSLEDSNYYRYPYKKTVETVCRLLEGKDTSYESLGLVFRSKEIAMINEINEANFLKDFGLEMEKLYFDDNYIIGIHGSLHSGYDIEHSRFYTGLLCIHGPRINRTVKTKEDGLDFYNFLSYKYYEESDVNAIIVRIPKNEITSPMWMEGKYGVYLNPGYLYGYYKSYYPDGRNRSPKIIKNPNYGNINFSYTITDEWLPRTIKIKQKY